MDADGPAALAAGDWAMAATAYETIVARRPDDVAAWAGLARARLGLRRRGDAGAAAASALALDPGHPAALTAWAAVCLDQGDLAAAERAAERALVADPTAAVARLLRAQVWAATGQSAAALAELDRAAADASDLGAVAAAKGMLLRSRGQLAEAEAMLGRALSLAPRSAEIEAALGVVLAERDDLAAAERHLRTAALRNPAQAEIQVHLGRLLERQGHRDDAADAYRQALAIDPDSMAAHVNLGALLRSRRDFGAALAHLERGAALGPQLADAQLHLGLGRYEDGDRQGAITALDRAAALAPDDERAHWARAVAELPIVPETEAEAIAARAGYGQALARLEQRYRDRPHQLAAAADALAVALPFYLPYQAGDDRDLQARYGRLVAAAMAATAPPDLGPAGAVPPPRDRLRVGIVSAHFRDHSVWKILTAGWLDAFDRDRFELIAYRAAPGSADRQSERAAKLADRMVGPAADWRRLALAIAADRCDALLYPEVGMDATTLQVAALRLAPFQAAAWGHPVTTGLPTIDAVLSSDLMEPVDGDRHYTERLVRLPGLSIHYRPVVDASVPPLDLGRFGVRPGDVTYLCCQSLFKYRPVHDGVLAAIARRVPRARFLFIGLPSERLTRRFERRVAAALGDAGIDPADRLVLLPRLSPGDYAGLNAAADIYLDSLDWSGGNTTLEALQAGLPVVTAAGRLMRGRHSAAILTALGLGERVAATPADYVEQAVALGRDPIARAELRAAIRAALPRLYADEAPIRAIEELIAASAR